MRPDVAFVYVRDLLERLTGERPEPDHDGDLPVQFDGALFFVRVVGPIDPWIQVFSVALAEVAGTADLMVRINEINRELRFARAFHVGSQVLIEAEIWADDLNPANFQHACRNVATATDAFAPKLLESFGGRLLFQDSQTEEYRQSPLPMGFAPGS